MKKRGGASKKAEDEHRYLEEIRVKEANLLRAEILGNFGYWDWDLTTNKVKWSDGHFRIFGYPVEHGSETYEKFRARVHPDDIDALENVLRERMLKDTNLNWDYRLLWPDGSIRYLHAEADKPVRDESGKPVRWFGIVQDVTERKLSEENQCENRRFTAALMGNLPGLVFRCRNDKDWTMEFLSPGCQKLTGYSIRDLSFNHKISYAKLIHSDDRERVWNEVQAAFRDKKPFTITYRIITANGEEKWVWTQGRRLFRNGNDIIEGYTFDITETKRAEEALNVAKQQAELYVDLMGHDINNFNHAAMGYLELALQELESEKRLRLEDKELIERPMHALANSSALINNVRKLQRLMTEGVKTKPTDLHKIFKELEAMSFPMDDRDILINIQHLPDIMVEANELLKDAFINLITNAVKHSNNEKPLTVNVKVEPVNENGQKYYRCIVEDDGPGIPDELKGKLFNRFQRGATKAHGKGLGLYLVRKLVEGYHGRVYVEDRVKGDYKKGCRFIVELPAALT